MFSKTAGSLLCYIALSHGVGAAVLPRGGDNANGHKWIDHDAVVALPQTTSPTNGELELRFNPHLYVKGGCDPYPAVDKDGNLGAGLKPTGGGRSGCDKGGLGQVYVRSGQSSAGRQAVLYSYYMPKVTWKEGGHRHYWASVVVWLNRWGCDTNDPTSLWPVGVSYTTDHLNWASAPAGKVSFKGSDVGSDQPTQPELQIWDREISPFTGADGDLVFPRTIASWDALPASTKQSLIDVQYEHTQVPITEANFQASLDAAYKSGIYGALPATPDCVAQSDPAGSEPQLASLWY
ncbi:hypothetical protein LY76DRAFT_634576 [Colletotrichum caudatum]|nr:hypothetical protein LY76DRAFT_634576 [Colletotrichum caudatum]